MDDTIEMVRYPAFQGYDHYETFTRYVGTRGSARYFELAEMEACDAF